MYRVFARTVDGWRLWAAFHLECDYNAYWDRLHADPVIAKRDADGIPFYTGQRPGGRHPSRIYSPAAIARMRAVHRQSMQSA